MLLARLAESDRATLSLRPGRLGWLVTSPLDLSVLRMRLRAWTRRVVPVHAASGRYFLEPNNRYLWMILSRVEAQRHGSFHDEPVRRERLRRLAPFLQPYPVWQSGRGAGEYRRIALRLIEGSSSEALWKHLAHDFDKLWAEVALMAGGFEPLQKEVLRHLCEPVLIENGMGTCKV